MIDLDEYIKTLPHWHKHRQGHVIKVTEYDSGRKQFTGEFYNYASGKVIQVNAGEEYHMHTLQSGELIEISSEELAKYLLLEKGSQ